VRECGWLRVSVCERSVACEHVNVNGCVIERKCVSMNVSV
jgi:hypothetical protein